METRKSFRRQSALRCRHIREWLIVKLKSCESLRQVLVQRQLSFPAVRRACRLDVDKRLVVYHLRAGLSREILPPALLRYGLIGSLRFPFLPGANAASSFVVTFQTRRLFATNNKRRIHVVDLILSAQAPLYSAVAEKMVCETSGLFKIQPV